MAVALRNGTNGALEQFKGGDSIQIDQIERLSGSGHLIIGSGLGATAELQLGSVANVVRVLGDFDIDGAMSSDLDMGGNDVLNAGNLVNAVFGRSGNVVAAAGDYAASQVTNDSGVSGTYVSDALDTLDGDVSDLVAITLTAGAGLTGGGDLSTNRTFDVVANADGSITVNANDIQVGILATDAQHGSRGGGTQHSVVTNSTAGFAPAVSSTAGALAYSTGTALDTTVLLRAITSPSAALEIGTFGSVATTGAIRMAAGNSLIAAEDEAGTGNVRLIEKDATSDDVNVGNGLIDMLYIDDDNLQGFSASSHPTAPSGTYGMWYFMDSGKEFWFVDSDGDRTQLV